jgi:hypothetical protein
VPFDSGGFLFGVGMHLLTIALLCAFLHPDVPTVREMKETRQVVKQAVANEHQSLIDDYVVLGMLRENPTENLPKYVGESDEEYKHRIDLIKDALEMKMIQLICQMRHEHYVAGDEHRGSCTYHGK